MRLVADVIAWCAEHAPKFNPISISGYHIREAGADAAQEVAFTLADGIAYVEAALDRGLHVDDFAPRLSFFFGVHNDFLEEVAKFRAARRLWASITRERFGAKKPKSWMLRFHSQTCGSTLTAQQPRNNVVRVALQALAAVLGGTQSLHTNGWDEALSLPTQESAGLALRTQQLIGFESGVTRFVDPLGGSYTVEALTDRVEDKAREILARIDEAGGAVAAVAAGIPQAAIEDTAYRYQLDIESGERVVVGMNRFHDPDAEEVPIARVSDAARDEQLAANAAVREKRDDAAVRACLKALDDVAAGDGNLMPAVLAAVEAYATVGEISDVPSRTLRRASPGLSWRISGRLLRAATRITAVSSSTVRVGSSMSTATAMKSTARIRIKFWIVRVASRVGLRPSPKCSYR